jgi:gas vesicle protein
MRQTTDFTKITLATIAGFGLGAVAMYVLDPVSGKRRRELARDKAAKAANSAVDTLQTTARDLQNRAKSVVGGTTSPPAPERPGSGVV